MISTFVKKGQDADEMAIPKDNDDVALFVNLTDSHSDDP